MAETFDELIERHRKNKIKSLILVDLNTIDMISYNILTNKKSNTKRTLKDIILDNWFNMITIKTFKLMKKNKINIYGGFCE